MNCYTNVPFTSTLSLVYPTFIFVPSLILYILITLSIRRNSSFHHPFFYQVIILGVLNSLFWISNFLLDRFIRIPSLCPLLFDLFSEPGFYLTPVFFTYFYTSLAQYFCVLIMILNRASVILKPLTFPQIWRKLNSIVIACQLFIPFAFSFLTLTWKGYLKFISEGQLIIDYMKPIRFYTNPINACIGALVFCVILILTFVSSICLMKMRYYHRIDSSVEIKLFFTSIYFSMTTMLFSIQQMLLFYYLSISPNDRMLSDLQSLKGPIVDFCAIAPPWIFIACIEEIRIKVFQLITKSIDISVSYKTSSSSVVIRI